MGQKLEKGCFGVVILVVILTLVALVVPYLDYQFGLFRISQQLQIEPTMLALTNYFEETFIPGVSQDEVDTLLQTSGAVRVKVNESRFRNCESVVYFIGYWPLNRLNLILCYDQTQHLESYRLIDED